MALPENSALAVPAVVAGAVVGSSSYQPGVAAVAAADLTVDLESVDVAAVPLLPFSSSSPLPFSRIAHLRAVMVATAGMAAMVIKEAQVVQVVEDLMPAYHPEELAEMAAREVTAVVVRVEPAA